MLSDVKVRNVKAGGAARKDSDQGGLYLFTSPSENKSWRYDYRFLGRRQTLVIGPYPEVTLRAARLRHQEARQLLESGVNPAVAKKNALVAKRAAAQNTLSAVAIQWFEELKPHRSRSWELSVGGWLRNYIVPRLGTRPINAIEPSEVLFLVKSIAKVGGPRAAEGVRWTISRIYSHAIRNLVSRQNPAREIRGALTLPPTKHNPILPAPELPALVERMVSYSGRFETKLALQLLLLTFVRKNELVQATWEEIDFESFTWRIPASRMKAREEHIVPLSYQVIGLLKQLHSVTGSRRHLFPKHGDPTMPMSDETLNAALVKLGYRGKLTPHGLRGTASTILNEQGWRSDVIERQLAHADRNRVRAAYNHAAYLDERRAMMQSWADYVSNGGKPSKVIQFRKAG